MAGLTIKQMGNTHGVGQKQPMTGDVFLGESTAGSFFWATIDQVRDSFGVVGDVAYPGDANFTVNGQQRFQVIEYGTALTGLRTVTLQSGGAAKDGDLAAVHRLSGAGTTFNIDVTGLDATGTGTVTLTDPSTSGVFVYDGPTNKWRRVVVVRKLGSVTALTGAADLGATGTPNSSTFLSGNWNWTTPPGGGDMLRNGTPPNAYDPNQDGLFESAVIATNAITPAKIAASTRSALATSGSIAIDLSTNGTYPALVATGAVSFTLAASPKDGAMVILPLTPDAGGVTLSTDFVPAGARSGNFVDHTWVAGFPYTLLIWYAAGKAVVTTWPAQTTDLANGVVEDDKLRDSGPLSVIGRDANTSGAPNDISVAAGSGLVLREASNVLGFGQVAEAGIADNAVTVNKIASNAVTQVKIADDAVGLAELASGTPDRVLGYDGSGNPVVYTQGVGITISGNQIAATPATSVEAVTLPVWNSSGVTIALGDPVFISGYDGGSNRPAVTKAQSSGSGTMPAIGIANGQILNGAGGTAVISGDLLGLDTSSFTAGSELYVATTGGLTASAPVAPNLVQQVATTVRQAVAPNGRIAVNDQRPNTFPNMLQDQLLRGSTSNTSEAQSIGDNTVVGRAAGSRIVGAQLVTAQVANDQITNALLANMAASTVKGAVGAGDPVDLTAAQLITIINTVATYQPLDADLTTLSTAFTSASSAGPASLKLAEDTDLGSTGVLLTGPATSASDKAVLFQDIAGTVYVSGGTPVVVADGGTGVQTLTSNGVLLGAGISPVTTAKQAPTGAFVGTTDTQTLTNKTISGASNTISNIALASQVTGTLPVPNGGTGVATLTSGNVLVGAGVSAVVTTQAAPVGAFVGTTDTQTLTNKTISGASNTLSNVNLATQVTGTLPVANGGTGVATITSGNFVLGAGTSPVTSAKVAPAGVVVGTTDAQTLTNKTISGAANTLSNINLATQVTGTLPLGNGGTGAALVDPNVDRILFWDDSAGSVAFLEASTGLTITGTQITSSGGAALFDQVETASTAITISDSFADQNLISTAVGAVTVQLGNATTLDKSGVLTKGAQTMTVSVSANPTVRYYLPGDDQSGAGRSTDFAVEGQISWAVKRIDTTDRRYLINGQTDHAFLDPVTNADLADMAAWTFKIRNAGSLGDPSDGALATITTEATPASGDFLVGFLNTGEIRKFDVGTMPGGGGGITASGTPVDNQVAIWTSATAVEGDTDLTFDGTTLAVANIDINGGVFTVDADADTSFAAAVDDVLDITVGGVRIGRFQNDGTINGKFEVRHNAATAAAGPSMVTYRDRAVPAAADPIGQYRFDGNNLTPAQVTYATMQGRIVDPTIGGVDGAIDIKVAVNSTLTDRIVIDNAGVTLSGTLTVPNTSFTYAKLQNVSANSRLLGSGSAGAGAPPSEITVSTGLTMTGTTLTTDAELSAIAGLTSAADQLPYFTGSGTAALTTLTSVSRTMLSQTTNALIMSTIGAAPLASPTFTGTVTAPIASVTTSLTLSGGATVNTSSTRQATPLATTGAGQTLTLNFANGDWFPATIAHATPTIALSNMPSGTVSGIILELINGGSQTITWPTMTWAFGVAPTLTASGKDLIGIWHDGDNAIYGVVLGKAFA